MTLLLGKKGQIAWALQRQFKTPLTAFGSESFKDFKTDLLLALLEKHRPKVLINAAGMGDLERVEKEPDFSAQLNVHGPQQLAQWCGKNGCLLIHFTSANVFDGKGSDFRQESEKLGPMNLLGKQQVEAESAIAKAGCPFFVFRTSWVYSSQNPSTGSNYLKKVLKMAEDQAEVFADGDQMSSPTSALELAKGVVKLLEKTQGLPQLPSGIYHMTGFDTATHLSWSQEIISQGMGLGFPIRANSARAKSFKDQESPVARPLNARLSNQKILRSFGIQLPPWRDSLIKVLNEMRGR